MSIGKDFFYDTLKYIPIKIMPAFSGILTVFFLTKKGLLDLPSYVDYTFIIAALLICSQIVGGWVNSSVIYYYTGYEHDSDREDFAVNISYLQLFFLWLGGVVLFSVIMFTLQSFVVALFTVGILFLQTFLTFNYSFFQAKRDIKSQVNATFLQALLQIAGVIGCYYFFKGSVGYVFFFLFLSYLITGVYMIVMKKNVMHLKPGADVNIDICKKILAYGLPICLWFFSTQLYQIGDRILFKYFNLTYHVGNYVSFRDLSVGLSGFIAMPLLFASHPIIIQLSKNPENKSVIEKLLRRNIGILSAVFLPVMIITYFYGDFLIQYIVGKQYVLKPALMVAVLFTILLGVIAIYLQKGIEAKGNTMLMLKISMITAVFSIVLNLVFIKTYGVVSAIYISLLSHIVYCVGIYLYSRKVFKIFL